MKNRLRESSKEFNFSDQNYQSSNSEIQDQNREFDENDKNNSKNYYHDFNNEEIAKLDLPELGSENEINSEFEDQSEEPVVNKTLVMLQKELHKSLFSPSLMKINESPKVSLLTDRSKNVLKDSVNKNSNINPGEKVGDENPFKNNIPNIFGMNIRPSSGEVVSPTSESSAHSIRKDHLSKDNRYQLQDDASEEEGNNSDLMSLESIVIK